MAKKGLDLTSMKTLEVNIGDGVDVKDTDMLDGAAKSSPVMDETNQTKQYSTAKMNFGELGDRNNLKG